MKKIKKYLHELWSVLRLPEMLILPGNLTFFLILSIVPLITLVGIITSFLSLPTDTIVSFLSDKLPIEIIDLLVSFVSGSGINTGNFIFLIVGFYVASNGPDSLITASNILYKNEDKGYVYRRVKALFMTFWLLLLFVFIIVVLAFGTFILNKLSMFGLIGKFIANNYAIITLIKFILAFIFLFLIIKIIYTLALSTKSKYVNRGAFFASISIIVVTTVYSFYVTNMAHYDIIYGGLASIAILMFLIYFISYILVLGMAINHNNYVNNN